MAILVDTDVLLVNRADETYQMTFAELEASVNSKLQNGLTLSGDPLPTFDDSDLFIVNRDDTTYKVSFAEIKNSISLGIPPVLTNVSLVENNPGVDPRFTSQTFTASTNLSVDGIPQSEKTFDAFVEGAFFVQDSFQEPLESYIGEPTFDTTYVNCKARNEAFDVYKAFDGITGNRWMIDPIDSSSTWEATTKFPEQKVTNGTFAFIASYSGTVSASGPTHQFFVKDINNNTYSADVRVPLSANEIFFITLPDNIILNEVGVKPLAGSYASSPRLETVSCTTEVSAVYPTINLLYIPKAATIFTFDSNAEIELLEYGDQIYQNGDPNPQYSLGISAVAQAGSISNPQQAFDGDEGTNAGANTGPIAWTPDTSSLTYSGNLRIITNPINTAGNIVKIYLSSDETGQARQLVYTKTVTPDIFTDLGTHTNITYLECDTESNTTASSIGAVELNGQILVDNAPLQGTVVSNPTDTSVYIDTFGSAWQINDDVFGPPKTVFKDDAKKYLDFDSNGNVSSLLDTPQSPAYVTTDLNPGLTLTFPATFPSGLTPDEELGDGTTLTVEVTVGNDVGTSGPLSATVQPMVVTPATSAIIQIDEEPNPNGGWKRLDAGGGTNFMWGIVYSNIENIFVTTGYNNGNPNGAQGIRWSEDGLTWNPGYSGNSTSAINSATNHGIAYAEDKQLYGVIGISGNASRVSHSTSGKTGWSSFRSIDTKAEGPWCIMYSKYYGKFYVGGGGNNYGANIFSSPDMINWTLVKQFPASFIGFGITGLDTNETTGRMVAGTYGYTNGSTGPTFRLAYSDDEGASWTDCTFTQDPGTSPYETIGFMKVCYNEEADAWVAGGADSYTSECLWRSTDGITWTPIPETLDKEGGNTVSNQSCGVSNGYFFNYKRVDTIQVHTFERF